jgi:hypothetical protein
MDNFNKIPSLVQIFIAEFFGVLLLSVPFSKFYEKIHPTVAYHSPPLDKWDYIFIALGALLIVWVLATIFRPGLHATRFVPVFHSGGLYVANPDMGADYLFSSTHPSYIFIDLLVVGFYWFVRLLWASYWTERAYQGTIMLGLALAIPILRLLAWYVLRLRPRGEKISEEVRSSWKPVAMVYGFFLLPLSVFGAGVWFYQEHQRKVEDANLTVVAPDTWKGNETFNALLDPKENVATTRRIRLRAMQKSAAAVTCTNDTNGVFAALVATLSTGHDVVIMKYGNATEDVDWLIKLANGNQGRVIETTGRMMQMPRQIPSWKRYCGLEKSNPRPVWTFE